MSESIESTVQAIANSLRKMPGIEIVELTDGYIHAVAKSRVMGFIDDIEFYIDRQHQLIHFRSASRIGYSDLGVNRIRMMEIREAFERESEKPRQRSL